MSDEPRVSIVMPAYQEGKHILPVLARVQESVTVDCEILVVVDSAGDATAAVLRGSEDVSGTVRLLVNDYGRGPATRSGTGWTGHGPPSPSSPWPTAVTTPARSTT